MKLGPLQPLTDEELTKIGLVSGPFTPAEQLAMRWLEHYQALRPIYEQSTPMTLRWLSIPERNLLITICERLIADYALNLTVPCRRCAGCGQIADDTDGTPWIHWQMLPAISAIAVYVGSVKPIPCPTCNGAGRIPLTDGGIDE